VEFEALLIFPSVDLGPVLRVEFREFAAICFSLAMTGCSALVVSVDPGAFRTV
jgi:hypothetical protein